MKKYLKSFWAHFLTVAGSPLTWCMVILLAAALLAFMSDTAKNLALWRAMTTLPEPESCALCDGPPLCRGLNLLRLDTGETVPLSALGGNAPPADASCINPALYCRECRAKIGGAVSAERITLDGYVWACSYGSGVIYIFPCAD